MMPGKSRRQLAAECSRLRDELAAARELHEKVSGQRDLAQTELRSAHAALDETRAQHEADHTEIDGLRATMQAERDAMNAERRGHDEKVSELEDYLAKARENLGKAEATRDRVIRELAGTVTELDRLRLDVETLGETVTTLQSDLGVAQAQARALTADNERLKAAARPPRPAPSRQPPVRERRPRRSSGTENS